MAPYGKCPWRRKSDDRKPNQQGEDQRPAAPLAPDCSTSRPAFSTNPRSVSNTFPRKGIGLPSRRITPDWRNQHGRWITDQSFYPSPKMAMEAPPRNHRLRLHAESAGSGHRCAWRHRSRSGIEGLRAVLWVGWTCLQPATSCTISDGMPVAPAFAHPRPIRT
jgi:hypothetical protein